MLGSLENPQSSGRFSFTLQRVLLLCAWTTTWKARPKRPLLQLYYRKSGAFEVEVSFDFYGNFAPHHEAISSHGMRMHLVVFQQLFFHIFSYSGFFPSNEMELFHIHLIFNLRIYNDILSFKFNCLFFCSYFMTLHVQRRIFRFLLLIFSISNIRFCTE